MRFTLPTFSDIDLNKDVKKYSFLEIPLTVTLTVTLTGDFQAVDGFFFYR